MKLRAFIFAALASVLVVSAMALVQPGGFAAKSVLRAPHYVGMRGSAEGGSSAFTPASIPGLQLWLDASQIVGLNDGDPVATWNDVSGNGFDFVQGTGSARPTYKTGILNGKPIVRFDGVDDKLTRANFITSAASTTFAVVTRSGGSAFQEVVVLGASGGSTGWVVLSASAAGGAGGNWGVYQGGWVESLTNLSGVWKTIRYNTDGASAFTLTTNNGTPESKTGSGFATINTSTVGGDEYNQMLTGDIAAILHYNRQLTTDEMNSVENWLLAQYAHY